jgi:hypothetical protein
MRGRSAFLITLSRGKITQWVADEWSIGRYAGVSENDLMKIRTRTVMKKWTSEDSMNQKIFKLVITHHEPNHLLCIFQGIAWLHISTTKGSSSDH